MGPPCLLVGPFYGPTLGPPWTHLVYGLARYMGHVAQHGEDDEAGDEGGAAVNEGRDQGVSGDTWGLVRLIRLMRRLRARGCVSSGYEFVVAYPGYELVASYPGYELVASYPGYELVAAYPGYELMTAYPGYELVAAYPGYELVAAYPGYELVAAYP
ncbi:hypothetical protein HAZT_HAZT011543 [Hyalella azteca]|uniref:Uncharacterized protein n=1 Tax=Hyalella azteca TaxID=294128 RepID=A0A6A0H5S7_HYAAZ|nr:hypothetical protein HAZT_HAZT011543 [Hyalella azteca]